MKRRGWEPIFKKQGRIFLKPQLEIKKLVKEFKKKRIKRVLDLGCGSGRHTVYLAKKGFEVYAFDISKDGVKKTKAWLEKEGLEVDVRVLEMTKRFPYKNNFFDAIISTQVINHNRLRDIKKTVNQIRRVLRPKGLLFVTLPSHPPYRNKNYVVKYGTLYKQIEPNTFIPMDGNEKGIPHHIFNEEEIRRLFKKFKLLDMRMGKWGHYAVLMQKT